MQGKTCGGDNFAFKVEEFLKKKITPSLPRLFEMIIYWFFLKNVTFYFEILLVHALFCPHNFSPQILCPFTFCPCNILSKQF